MKKKNNIKNNVIDFESNRIRLITHRLCQKYHQPYSFFNPLVNKLIEHGIKKTEEIEQEIDFFMHIREYSGKIG